MTDVPVIRCPVCEAELKITTSKSKTGKVALVLACPRDGRDFRAFINNRDYVRRVLDSLESTSPRG
jgi:uncharacterized C2H2 Zn-finger protein